MLRKGRKNSPIDSAVFVRNQIWWLSLLVLVFCFLVLLAEYWWIPLWREEKIKASLPSGGVLREAKRIFGVWPPSYLVIWIDQPFLGPPLETRDLETLACPETVIGQGIYGIYHLALFQNNALINDLIIPSATETDNSLHPFSGLDRFRGTISYKNTRENIYYYFGGPKPENEKKYQIEKVNLIRLADYTGDSREYEFRLTGKNCGCGHTLYLIAGYDWQKNRVVLYPFIEGDSSFHWQDNFLPDSQGRVEWEILCGDHGYQANSYKTYQFDSQKEGYVLIKESKEPCDQF